MRKKPLVAILDDYQDAARTLDCFSILESFDVRVYRDTIKDPMALAARLADADAVVLIRERTRLENDTLSRLPRLRIISQTGGAVANIDVGACTRLGVAVACARAGTAAYAWAASHASAEFTWALILCSRRKVLSQAAALKNGQWQTDIGNTVRGATLGIVGYGKIGAQVAQIGRAFGMHVLAYGRDGSRNRAAADGLEVAGNKRILFERADVVSVHVGLNDETRGIITRADLDAMKASALFVNTGRAALVEPGALLGALQAGRPGYAAVDVYDDEPLLDPAHPLLHMGNVLCTPHIAFVERESYEASFRNGFEQIRSFFSGTPIHLVNPEALKARRAR